VGTWWGLPARVSSW